MILFTRLKTTAATFSGAVALTIFLSAGIAHAQYATGFEAPFTTGNVDTQQGWTTNTADTTSLLVSTANPATGTQSLRLTNDVTADPAAGDLTFAFSPVFTPVVGATRASADFYISDFLGANYIFAVQSTAQSLLTARIEFDFRGTIFVQDDLGDGAGVTFVDTGFHWQEDMYQNVAVEVDPVADSLKYYYDNALIYTGVGGTFGGDSIDQVVVGTDNFQLTGEFGDVDNIFIAPIVIPESDTAGLLGAGILALGGTLLVARRRKPVGV